MSSPRRGAGVVVVAAAALLLTSCSAGAPTGVASATSVPVAPTATAAPPTPTDIADSAPQPPRFLLPGEAAALPAVAPGVPFTGHLLIAENSAHSRLLEIDASGAVTWRFATTAPPLTHPLGPPDDAFYGADGTTVLVSSEDGQGALALDRADDAVLWQVGTYLQKGRDAHHFSNPDDLAPAPDGTAWMADIGNCRILHLDGGGTILGQLGAGCRHAPPGQFASPNGAFPTRDGSLVVTEIGGSWVDWINPDGSLRWSRHVPAAYPSDAVAEPDGSVLFTDYSLPGSVIRMGADGKVLWHYTPAGGDRLNHTSIALPLASNRVAICDDLDNRIVVVDPTTSTVVWRWGGSGADTLLHPDGIDYRPS